MWGYFSDKIGRRKVLLIGTFGTSISCLIFGLSKFYWWALLSRAFFGFVNGNLGVAKTYLREITDETNQAKAFSLLTIAFSSSLLSNFNLFLKFHSWSVNWRFFE
jgi:MFS family permease